MEHGVEDGGGPGRVDLHHHVLVGASGHLGVADHLTEGSRVVGMDDDPAVLGRVHLGHRDHPGVHGLVGHDDAVRRVTGHRLNRGGLLHGGGGGFCRSRLLSRRSRGRLRHCALPNDRQGHDIPIRSDKLRCHPALGLHIRHLNLEPGGVLGAAQGSDRGPAPQAGHNGRLGAGALPHAQGIDVHRDGQGRCGLGPFIGGCGGFLCRGRRGRCHLGLTRRHRRQQEGHITLEGVATGEKQCKNHKDAKQ